MGLVIDCGVYARSKLTLIHLVMHRVVHTLINHQWVVCLHGLLPHVLNAYQTKRVHKVLFLEVLLVVLGMVEVLLNIHWVL